GLSFGPAYQNSGVKGFFHVSSKRDHQTLKNLVDYQEGQVAEGGTVIIADPMLATGNTVIDAIERLVASGVSPEKIIVNAVVAAPIGIKKVKTYHPGIQVVVGALDEKLDHRGYIVDGLGDFGDKYFADFSSEDLGVLSDKLGLIPESRQQLIKRFGL
ncbi:hypothetical protein IT411_02310, partial [Candidatus Peregrinibacteria bacterium]|nr:hypothetical protein [Candidatus Peregrinibacteria bacterium]